MTSSLQQKRVPTRKEYRSPRRKCNSSRENAIQALPHNVHFLSIFRSNQNSKEVSGDPELITRHALRPHHQAHARKSVDSSLLGRSDWNNNNPEISKNTKTRQTASSRKKNKNNTERKIIQNNYIICETKWKIIHAKPFLWETATTHS